MNERERRWYSLVNVPVQLGLLALFATGVILVVLILCSFIWFCLYVLYSTVFMLTRNPELLQQVKEMIWNRAYVALGTLLVVTTIFSFLTMRLTNRIAGPIYRITQELRNMLRKGEVHEVSIRDDDFFQDMVRSLNRVLRLAQERMEQEGSHSPPP